MSNDENNENEPGLIEYLLGLAEEDAREEAKASEEITDRAKLFNWLLSRSVAVVKVHFDGSGDSGQIEEIVCYGVSGRKIELELGVYALVERDVIEPAHARIEAHSVRDVLENLFYDATEQYDWVNNDGGYGDVWFVVADPKMIEFGAWPLCDLEDLVHREGAEAGAILVDMNVREMTSEQHVYGY